MLQKAAEMGDEHNLMPIVSIIVVADKNKCPTGFTPVVKTYDDSSDADLWKDGFGFGIFNRVVRYLAIGRHVSETHCMEVVTDLAIISEKEAVPNNFVCIDFTADTKEKALKKKYLCARFSPRNDSLDAVSDVIILARAKKPPKGYTSAGDIDGMLICYKVTTIPETYGRLRHSQSSEMSNAARATNAPSALYPDIHSDPYRHSTGDLDKLNNGAGGVSAFTIKASANNVVKGVDGVPFQLSPIYSKGLAKEKASHTPEIPELRPAEHYSYNFSLERSIVTT